MKPAAFDYVRALSVEHALATLAVDPSGAKVIAGGQSLMTLMNLRLARPSVLIDVGRLDELARVFSDDDRLVLGALVRHRTLETDHVVAQRVPMLAEAAAHIGHVAIRNRGTLGGALSHADPAAELPAVMVALGATIHVESAERGRRDIPAEEFFVSIFTTALEADELVTWVSVPALDERAGWGFVEYAPRHGDYAQAGACAVLQLSDDGTVSRVRAVLLNAADRPLLVSRDRDVVGRQPSEALWGGVARDWALQVEPDGNDADDVHGLFAAALTDVLTSAHRRALRAMDLGGRNE